MAEQSTTPDVLELWRRIGEAVHRRNYDTPESLCAPDGAMEVMGLGIRFGGRAAIRRFYEDWLGSYEKYESSVEEVHTTSYIDIDGARAAADRLAEERG
ncbi:MAG TPA: hypothetical protein VKG62_03390 [Solirubrobacteraceae bacterium]|nr:hypothetical protein [Solirubrobacteraceae bacterium]